jgi:membrane protein
MAKEQSMADRRRGREVVTQTYGLWSSHAPFQHAAALAFCALFSLAPLLIILVTVTGAVFGEEAVRGEISARLVGRVGPQAAAAVEEAVSRSRVEVAGLWPTLLGVAALLVGGTSVFAQMQRSFNTFWGVAPHPRRNDIVVFLTTRLVSLVLVLVIGLLLLASVAMGMSVGALVRFLDTWVEVPIPVVAALHAVVALGLTTLLAAMTFKILPDVNLRWSDVWRGAFVTASLFVGGQWLLSLYLTRAAVASAYGAAGALVILLMWVYYSSLILLLGVAVTRAMVEARGGRLVPKGRAVSTVAGDRTGRDGSTLVT